MGTRGGGPEACEHGQAQHTRSVRLFQRLLGRPSPEAAVSVEAHDEEGLKVGAQVVRAGESETDICGLLCLRLYNFI